MDNIPKLLSGRVPVVDYGNLSSDRYQFLGVSEAEPNLGPGADSTVLTITTNNTRSWSNTISLTGNIAGDYFIGNGSQLTGISTGNITFSNTTISTNLVNGNILLQATGTGLVQIGGTGGLVIPAGTTIQEPVPPTTATIRFNSDTANIEFYNGSQWVTLSPVYNIANQTINGDGIHNTFVLNQSASADTVFVTINGVSQTPNVDYTISFPDITFTTIPQPGDVIQIRFLAGTLAGSGNSGGATNYIVNGTSYASIATANGNVVINADTYPWTFDITGNLTLPNSSNFGDATITQTDTNTSGVNSSSGTFPYLNYNVNLVGYVVTGPGVSGATVISQDQGSSTIVITGGTFQAGQTYQFSTAFGTVGTALEVDGSSWIFGFNGVTAMPGNVSVAGNVRANAFVVGIGSFTGDDQSGDGALYAGIELFTRLPSNVVVQFAGNANSYSQVNFQNIDPGIASTTDYIATADNGSDTAHFVDMGIAGGSYVPGSYNSLGTALSSNDGYVYVQGSGTGSAGNLVIGTNELNGVVRIIANGSDTANVVAEFSKTGVSAVGNITGNYFIGNGSQLTGIQTTSTEPSFGIYSNNFSATIGNRYGVNTTGGSVTATLPASPTTGGAVFFADAGGAFATNNLIINPNGRTIMGATGNMTVSTNNQSFGLFYNGSTWRTYNAG